MFAVLMCYGVSSFLYKLTMCVQDIDLYNYRLYSDCNSIIIILYFHPPKTQRTLGAPPATYDLGEDRYTFIVLFVNIFLMIFVVDGSYTLPNCRV